MTKVEVGQDLYFVSTQRGIAPAAVRVIRVGRKWFETEYFPSKYRLFTRFSIETLQGDDAGYSSPGRCYLTRSEYEAKVSRNKAWDGLRSIVSGSYGRLSPGVSEADIRQAAALLQIELKP